MHETLDKNKVVMVGVCYDRDMNVVRNFIQKRQIDWNQLFDSQQAPSITRSYEITAYPTLILIDPEGKIVFRDEGLTGLQNLSEQMDKLIPSRQ